VAENSDIDVELVSAEPLLLHAPPLARTDANSPLLRRGGSTLAFMSHYKPIGHTYRRAGEKALWPTATLEPVKLLDDPTPEVGKWIESVWRAPDDRLFGWYHAEEVVPCAKRLFLPHIGALRSDDEGRTWRLVGEVLRVPYAEADCGYQNGFLTGGYGDFCVVSDRPADWFYLHYSAYVADERAQGVSVLRYPVSAADRPAALEIWCDGRWQPNVGRLEGTPIFGVRRGWRHRDPAAFWGPAIHYNRDLDCFVMLLNWTENGASDIVQRGVFVSYNDNLANPAGWSVPRQIVEGGSWYPQAIGLGPDDGDTLAGAEARFFLSGFSAWSIRFDRVASRPRPRPLIITRDTFIERFGFAPW
jgi:hypothetical protein